MLSVLSEFYNAESISQTIEKIVNVHERFCADLTKTPPSHKKKKKSTILVKNEIRDYLETVKNKHNVASINYTLYLIINQVYDKEINVIKRYSNILKDGKSSDRNSNKA